MKMTPIIINKIFRRESHLLDFTWFILLKHSIGNVTISEIILTLIKEIK